MMEEVESEGHQHNPSDEHEYDTYDDTSKDKSEHGLGVIIKTTNNN